MKTWIYVTQDSLRFSGSLFYSSFKRISYSKNICISFPSKHEPKKSLTIKNSLGKASSQKCWPLFLEQDRLFCPLTSGEGPVKCLALHRPATRRASQPAVGPQSWPPAHTRASPLLLLKTHYCLCSGYWRYSSFCSNRSCTFVVVCTVVAVVVSILTTCKSSSSSSSPVNKLSLAETQSDDHNQCVANTMKGSCTGTSAFLGRHLLLPKRAEARVWMVHQHCDEGDPEGVHLPCEETPCWGA